MCVVIQGTGGGGFSLERGQQWVHSGFEKHSGGGRGKTHFLSLVYLFCFRVLFVNFLLLRQITWDNQLIKQKGL